MTVLGSLPLEAAGMSEGDEIVYTEVGGGSVTYKVEKVRYVCEYAYVEGEGPDRYSCYGRTDYIVSVA